MTDLWVELRIATSRVETAGYSDDLNHTLWSK
jgi:hypothetical protein